MKFSEYPLYNAIHDVYCEFEQTNLKPRSADWLIYRSKREQLKSLINSKLVDSLYTEEDMLKAWDDFGKNKSKYKLLIAAARRYGCHCFYEGREQGKCSHIMSIERIHNARNEPLKIENSVIVCKKHNTDCR